MPKRYLTVKETADRLGVHDRTVRRYLRDEKLTKYTTPTGQVRIDVDEVEAFISPAPAVIGS